MIIQDYADKAFLALTLWREARGESIEVRIAIAFVILNRVKNPGWWGKDIMSVLFKKWQFSSLTDPKDKQLTTWPAKEDKQWQECLKIACDILDGQIKNPIFHADSYYDISIPAPKWATPNSFIKQIGRVRFYGVQNH